MGLIDKMKNAFGYPEDEEYYQDDEEILQTEKEEPDFVMQSRIKSPIERTSSVNRQQFVLTKPDKFDDSIQIANYLLERKTVVLNLEATGKDSTRRIIDFLSGTAFAVGARIKKVAVSTYIVIPKNADISGEMSEELENSGMLL